MVCINKRKITKRHLTYYKIYRRFMRWLIGFHPSIYFQDIEQVKFGQQVWIGPHACFITHDHNKEDLATHDEHQPITIGENCWIGANAVVLPGVTLGERTIVGAGSIVTKSFKDGHCIIAGNPATVLEELA